MPSIDDGWWLLIRRRLAHVKHWNQETAGAVVEMYRERIQRGIDIQTVNEAVEFIRREERKRRERQQQA